MKNYYAKNRINCGQSWKEYYIYIICVTLKNVYDRNVVNKYRIYYLLGVITLNLIDYIYIYNKFTEASHHNTLNITQNRWM